MVKLITIGSKKTRGQAGAASFQELRNNEIRTTNLDQSRISWEIGSDLFCDSVIITFVEGSLSGSVNMEPDVCVRINDDCNFFRFEGKDKMIKGNSPELDSAQWMLREPGGLR